MSMLRVRWFLFMAWAICVATPVALAQDKDVRPSGASPQASPSPSRAKAPSGSSGSRAAKPAASRSSGGGQLQMSGMYAGRWPEMTEDSATYATGDAQLMEQRPYDPSSLEDNPFPKREDVPAEQLYDVEGGFLGVHHETHKFLVFDSGKGARVLNVVRGSPASRGGLNRDDIITHFNGRRVTKSEELDRFVRETRAGTIVVVDVLRGTKRYQTVVQIVQQPAFDRLYRRDALQFPFPVPFIVDYEAYKAFDYMRLNFVWPAIQYEKTGRKQRVTLVTWPLQVEYETRN